MNNDILGGQSLLSLFALLTDRDGRLNDEMDGLRAR